jgi:xanthine dehydrogenase YagS FAD-binding subunit
MRSFTHINVRTIEEACEILEKYSGKARLKAGGTDLLLVLKDDILPEYPRTLINLMEIVDLAYIREEKEYLKIGALTTLRDIACSAILQDRYPVLADAALSVASPQIRNVATIGGNLCQDVRCWYYRYSSKIGGPIKCLRKGSGPCLAIKGDNRYHAIIGGKKCFAVCPSDTAVALAALDALVTVTGPSGDRDIAVQDIYHPLGISIKKNEMIREISIPIVKAKEVNQKFIKFTLRKPVDYAIVSVASVITLKDGVCDDARIVLGAVAPGPYRAFEAEKLIIGNPITEGNVAKAAEQALSGAKPLSKNGYKIQIAKTLIKRSIESGGK